MATWKLTWKSFYQKKKQELKNRYPFLKEFQIREKARKIWSKEMMRDSDTETKRNVLMKSSNKGISKRCKRNRDGCSYTTEQEEDDGKDHIIKLQDTIPTLTTNKEQPFPTLPPNDQDEDSNLDTQPEFNRHTLLQHTNHSIAECSENIKEKEINDSNEVSNVDVQPLILEFYKENVDTLNCGLADEALKNLESKSVHVKRSVDNQTDSVHDLFHISSSSTFIDIKKTPSTDSPGTVPKPKKRVFKSSSHATCSNFYAMFSDDEDFFM